LAALTTFEVHVSEKFLIVGLGNPGREYRLNRHNLGFMILDRLVEHHKLMPFTKRQGKALITTGVVADVPVILAKPQTYMNLSGEAVGSLMHFYEISTRQLLVCCDDLDLPVGTLRLRPRGTAGGQKGLKSIVQSLGTDLFPRLRIGIGRPSGRQAPSGHVLQDFTEDELELINLALDRAVPAIETFVTEGVVLAMSRYNGPATREDAPPKSQASTPKPEE
jgi:peptidyl-tRNA hydrolase, PTH1 family